MANLHHTFISWPWVFASCRHATRQIMIASAHLDHHRSMQVFAIPQNRIRGNACLFESLIFHVQQNSNLPVATTVIYIRPQSHGICRSLVRLLFRGVSLFKLIGLRIMCKFQNWISKLDSFFQGSEGSSVMHLSP